MIYQQIIDQAHFLNLTGDVSFTHEQVLSTMGRHLKDIEHHSKQYMLRHFENGRLAYTLCGNYLVGDSEVADMLALKNIVPICDDVSGTAFKGEDYEGFKWFWNIGTRPTKNIVPATIKLCELEERNDILSESMNSESASNRNKPTKDALTYIVNKASKIADDEEEVMLDPGDEVIIWTNARNRRFAYVPDINVTVEIDDRTMKRIEKRMTASVPVMVALAPIQGSKIYSAKIIANKGEAKRFGERQARGHVGGKIPVAILTINTSELVKAGVDLDLNSSLSETQFKELRKAAIKKTTVAAQTRSRIVKERELHFNTPSRNLLPVYASNSSRLVEQFFSGIQYDGVNVEKAKSPVQIAFDKNIPSNEVKQMLKGLGIRFAETYVGAKLVIKAKKMGDRVKATITADVDQSPEANERTLRLIEMGIEGQNKAFLDHKGDTFVAEKINYLEGSVTGKCTTRSGYTTTTVLRSVETQREIL